MRSPRRIQALARKARDVGSIPTRISMDTQAYILSRLERLTEPSVITYVPQNDDELIDFIYKTITSKKFRKVSVPTSHHIRIRNEITSCVQRNAPILIHFPFGGYKLWRLEETPEPDWAELFSTMYYIHWLKPICAVYKPGVHFVYRFDEVIVKKLNNILESETEAYRKSFERIINFISHYKPQNFSFEIFFERSRYASYSEFEKELSVEIEALREEREKSPYTLSPTEIAMIDLNVRLVPGQADDPHWREENDLIHNAYYNLQENKQHQYKHYTQEGIVAFPFIFDSTNVVPIGSTKTSTAKFWVGVGALQKRGESYIETILSPSQIAQAETDWESVHIPGLEGKNFSRVRVVK